MEQYQLLSENKMKKVLYLAIVAGSMYGATVQSGFWNHTFTGQQLFYYTILSNFIIGFYYFYILIQDIKNHITHDNRVLSANVRGAFTLMIIITGIIYHLLLAPHLSDINHFGLDAGANFLIHTAVPLLVFIDWIFFFQIKNPDKLTPIYWLSVPFAYLIIAVSYSTLKVPFITTGTYFAYNFIDFNRGLGETTLNIFLLSLFFLGLGYALKLIKKFQNGIS